MAACLSARLMPVSWKCRARRESPRGVRGSVTRWRPRRDIAPRCKRKSPATGQLPVRGGGSGDSVARAAAYSLAAPAYTMVVCVDRSSASAALKSVSFTQSHECSQCANRASPDFLISCKIDASTLFQVTRETSARGRELSEATCRVPERRDDSRCHGVEERAVRHLRPREWQRNVEAIVVPSRYQVHMIVEHVLSR